MKNTFLVIIILFCSTSSYGQKPSESESDSVLGNYKTRYFSDFDPFTMKGVSEISPSDTFSFPFVRVTYTRDNTITRTQSYLNNKPNGILCSDYAFINGAYIKVKTKTINYFTIRITSITERDTIYNFVEEILDNSHKLVSLLLNTKDSTISYEFYAAIAYTPELKTVHSFIRNLPLSDGSKIRQITRYNQEIKNGNLMMHFKTLTYSSETFPLGTYSPNMTEDCVKYELHGLSYFWWRLFEPSFTPEKCGP